MALKGWRIKAAAVCICAVATALVPAGARAGEGKARLMVAAASDLSFALREVSLAFERSTGIKVVTSFGSTATLAMQVSQGAPYDVLFTADTAHMEALKESGRVIPGTVRVFAEGRLALVANRVKGVRAVGLKDLLDPAVKRVAIANPEHAPYGRAAVEALKGAGIWDGVRGKLVYGENVRHALQFVQTGDADAGIAALSIADVPEVAFSAIDAGLHRPIYQAVAVVARPGADRKAAESFVAYATGLEAGRVFEKYGFTLKPGH
jgi:molybdate transport system substrate-binding protein